MVKAEGAISIAITRTPAKRAKLLEIGADHVIVTDEEDLVARINEITSGKGARLVFDPIGGKILESLAAATASKGHHHRIRSPGTRTHSLPTLHRTCQVPYHPSLYTL